MSFDEEEDVKGMPGTDEGATEEADDSSSLQVVEASVPMAADDDLPAGDPRPTPTTDLLEEQLAQARSEADDLREQLLRRKAEFDNYRRRVERERQQAAEEARAEVIREFLPAMDNLERAQRIGGDEGSVRRGVEMIYSELQKALARLDVRSHEPVGERFDPLSQQALLYEEVPGFVDGTVVEVYRRSYHLTDRLLRPAMVKVAKGAEPVESDPSQDANK